MYCTVKRKGKKGDVDHESQGESESRKRSKKTESIVSNKRKYRDNQSQ